MRRSQVRRRQLATGKCSADKKKDGKCSAGEEEGRQVRRGRAAPTDK